MLKLPNHRQRQDQRTRRAFTLAELVVALGISSILIVGSGVVLTSTMTQLDRGVDATARKHSLSRALDTIAADCAVATAIDDSSPSKLILTVPDRTGDANPETITYIWDNQSGGTITRTFNSDTSTLARNIDSFSFTPIVRPAPIITTSTNQQLHAFDPTSSAPVSFSDTEQFALVFRPGLPSNATAWSITSIQLQIGRNGANTGTFVIELRTATGSEPATTVISSTTVQENTFSGSSSTWTTFPLTASNLLPSDSVCVVVRSLATGHSAGSIQLGNGQSVAAGQVLWYSDTSGSNWRAPSSGINGMPIRVSGTFTTRQEQ